MLFLFLLQKSTLDIKKLHGTIHYVNLPMSVKLKVKLTSSKQLPKTVNMINNRHLSKDNVVHNYKYINFTVSC